LRSSNQRYEGNRLEDVGSCGCGSPRDRFARLRRWIGAACLLVSGTAFAQDVRPGDDLPPLPAFETEEWAELLPLVPLRAPVLETGPAGDALRAGSRVYVREVHVRGSGAIAAERLAEIASPYEDRELSLEDVEALRDAVTQAYVEAGYLTSEATVPEQPLEGGVLEVDVIEGRLAAIEVSSDGRLREGWVRRRIELGLTAPLDVRELRRRLDTLRRDDRIQSLEAELVPNGKPGESDLRLQLAETRRWWLALGGDNHANPWLGEARGTLVAGYDDLLGRGDRIALAYAGGEGLQDVAGWFSVPITPGDTRLELSLRRTWSEIVEQGLGNLDDSETATYGVGLAQPVYRREGAALELYARGEIRRSDEFPFSDTFPLAEDGKSKFTLLRIGADWVARGTTRVFAARAQVTRGFDALGASKGESDDFADAEFFAGLFQLRLAQRLPFYGLELHARGQAQISDEPLLGIEQISLGGHESVRGYREDQAVRDQGVVGSLELHIPVWLPLYWREWRPELVLVPFLDAGRAWNRDRGDLPSADDETLLSAGVGARMRLLPRLSVEVDWGYGLEDADSHGDDSLQGRGLHLGARWAF
jgi:hemolysin activation/secretion protein